MTESNEKGNKSSGDEQPPSELENGTESGSDKEDDKEDSSSIDG